MRPCPRSPAPFQSQGPRSLAPQAPPLRSALCLPTRAPWKPRSDFHGPPLRLAMRSGRCAVSLSCIAHPARRPAHAPRPGDARPRFCRSLARPIGPPSLSPPCPPARARLATGAAPPHCPQPARATMNVKSRHTPGHALTFQPPARAQAPRRSGGRVGWRAPGIGGPAKCIATKQVFLQARSTVPCHWVGLLHATRPPPTSRAPRPPPARHHQLGPPRALHRERRRFHHRRRARRAAGGSMPPRARAGAASTASQGPTSTALLHRSRDAPLSQAPMCPAHSRRTRLATAQAPWTAPPAGRRASSSRPLHCGPVPPQARAASRRGWPHPHARRPRDRAAPPFAHPLAVPPSSGPAQPQAGSDRHVYRQHFLKRRGSASAAAASTELKRTAKAARGPQLDPAARQAPGVAPGLGPGQPNPGCRHGTLPPIPQRPASAHPSLLLLRCAGASASQRPGSAKGNTTINAGLLGCRAGAGMG
jgi:hypothetical protein